MLLYVKTKSKVFERDIKHITEKAFYSAKPRVIFKSSPMFTTQAKDKYQFKIIAV